MERLGFGYEELKKINPRIIYASSSGYGRGGPYSHYSAMDLTVQAHTGEDPGYFGFFARVPELDAAVIFLSNTDYGLGRSNYNLEHEVLNLVTGCSYRVVAVLPNLWIAESVEPRRLFEASQPEQGADQLRAHPSPLLC